MPGFWETPILNWGFATVHCIHLRTGKFLLLGWRSAAGGTDAALWDPASPTVLSSINAPPPWDLFCCGHSALADGRILCAGGGFSGNQAPIYDVRFDPQPSPPVLWEGLEDMYFRRWYPTCTTLPSGEIAAFSGWVQHTWAIWAEYPEVFDPATGLWEAIATYRRQELYPFMFVMPDGRLFDAGPQANSAFLDISAKPWVWGSDIPTGIASVHHASCAMYDAATGKILRSGGAYTAGYPNEGIANAIVFKGAANPVWAATGSMNFIRVNHNLVCLPDGKVLAVGGARYLNAVGSPPSFEPVMRAEVFDPATDTWTADPFDVVMERPRWYHSTAILLRDARVLVAGGDDVLGPTTKNGQIYRPPYLFGNPQRPVILSADTTLQYGQQYEVKYQHDPSVEITKAALTRLGACTHGFDHDQRYLPLAMSVSGDTVTVTIPNKNVAPPGWYMLWIVDENGVPCAEAAYVKLAP